MSDQSPFDFRTYTNLQDRVLTTLGQQLSEISRDINRRLDSISSDSKEVGERLARIEGLQVGSVQELKDVKEELKMTRVEAKVANEKVNKLENRVVRLETLIVPAVGLVSAGTSAILGHFFK